MQDHPWADSVPFAITLCDCEGNILDMNEKSIQTFAKDGGNNLIGKSLFNCHSPKDNRKIVELIENEKTNAYTIEREGKKKFIFQCPWYQDGKTAGLVEISIPIPETIPHFNRDVKMIYHITRPEVWQEAELTGSYLPENFEKDGFIHCSKKEQIPIVGKRFYSDQSGLILLSINLSKLHPNLKWENTEGGDELFPHIYGALNSDAVEFIAQFKSNNDGDFAFPEKWEKV
mgnify:CR=1 FL=1